MNQELKCVAIIFDEDNISDIYELEITKQT